MSDMYKGGCFYIRYAKLCFGNSRQTMYNAKGKTRSDKYRDATELGYCFFHYDYQPSFIDSNTIFVR